mgnify:CR=1 FL=1
MLSPSPGHLIITAIVANYLALLPSLKSLTTHYAKFINFQLGDGPSEILSSHCSTNSIPNVVISLVRGYNSTLFVLASFLLNLFSRQSDSAQPADCWLWLRISSDHCSVLCCVQPGPGEAGQWEGGIWALVQWQARLTWRMRDRVKDFNKEIREWKLLTWRQWSSSWSHWSSPQSKV